MLPACLLLVTNCGEGCGEERDPQWTWPLTGCIAGVQLPASRHSLKSHALVFLGSFSCRVFLVSLFFLLLSVLFTNNKVLSQHH